MQRTLFYHFLCQKIPQRIRIRLGNHIFFNWKQKSILQKTHSAKKELLAQKISFPQAEIRSESRKVPFDQMKVSEKTQ